MTDINVVALVGRLTRDAELRHANSGTAILSFSLAVNRYGGKEKGEQASFVDCTLFGKQASAVAKYATKGKQVAVDGELVQERWTNKDNENRSKLVVHAREMQLLGGKTESSKDDFDDDVDF